MTKENLPIRKRKPARKKLTPIDGTPQHSRPMIVQSDVFYDDAKRERSYEIALVDVIDAEIKSIREKAEKATASCVENRREAQRTISMADAAIAVHEEVEPGTVALRIVEPKHPLSGGENVLVKALEKEIGEVVK